MQHTINNPVLVALVTAWTALAGLGCDDSCAGIFRCPVATGGGSGAGGQGGSGGGEPDPCPEDPADGPVADGCGVWVTASWGDDSRAGGQAEPVASIAQAIALAKAGTGRIYACGEVFAEVVKLPSGISLYGGFSCARGAWTYEGKGHWSTIAPGFPTVAALTLLPGTQESLLMDLRVESVDAIEPGGTSLAVLSLDGARGTIKRSHFIAGNGADGADGEDGAHNGVPAKSGLQGNDGANACTGDPGLGGLGLELDCGGVITSGGNGGDGGELFANDGWAGLQPPNPNPQGYGTGGKAQSAAPGTLCTSGSAGIQGNSGDHGAGAAGLGRLTEKGYIGTPGANGIPGTPGQGGGGGGASIGSALCGAGMPHGGAGGGSGGTGGCGGKPGKGGQAGGSSIALAVLGAGLALSDVRLTSGNGGNGGNGGALQPGGQGGLPGLGGLSFGGANGVKAGCHGGAGGQGGNGGNGGGGLGGHAVSLALVEGVFVIPAGPIPSDYGSGGFGGDGGNKSLRGTTGQGGVAAGNLAFPP